MPEPQTEAGKALLEETQGRCGPTRMRRGIAAIEAEARAECKAQLDRADAVVTAARKVKLDWADLNRPTDLMPLFAALAAYDGADKVAEQEKVVQWAKEPGVRDMLMEDALAYTEDPVRPKPVEVCDDCHWTGGKHNPGVEH